MSVSTDNINSTNFYDWLIDFQSSVNVVWAVDCTQNLVLNKTRSCSNYPTLLTTTYGTAIYANYTNASVGLFTGMTFSGYTTNGVIVLNSVCV